MRPPTSISPFSVIVYSTFYAVLGVVIGAFADSVIFYAVLLGFWGLLGGIVTYICHECRQSSDLVENIFIVSDRAVVLAWMGAFTLSLPGAVLGAMLYFLAGVENAVIYGIIIGASFGAILGGAGAMVGAIVDRRDGTERHDHQQAEK